MRRAYHFLNSALAQLHEVLFRTNATTLTAVARRLAHIAASGKELFARLRHYEASGVELVQKEFHLLVHRL